MAPGVIVIIIRSITGIWATAVAGRIMATIVVVCHRGRRETDEREDR
jgi:hypothetical protein